MGKSYKQWLKEVQHIIEKQGYSEQYANAITMCVRSNYSDKGHYMEPRIAANKGLYPQPYIN